MQSLLLLGIIVLAASYVPQCFRYRRDYLVQSTSSGSIDIRLVVDTAALISGSRIQNDCANIRFKQAGGSWLDFWWESKCNDAGSRVWVRPDFQGTDVVIEMYYGCRQATGGFMVPSASYGTALTWSGDFYVLSDRDCTSPWSTVTVSHGFDDYYIAAVDAPGRRQYNGAMWNHGHTSSVIIPATTKGPERGWASTVTNRFVSTTGHTHSFQGTVGDPDNEWPPYLYYEVCASPLFDLVEYSITMMSGSYSGLSGRWDRFSNGDDYLISGGGCNAGSCPSGGSETHKHRITGVTGAPNTGFWEIGWGTHKEVSGYAHTHPIDDFDTTEVSNMPPYIPTVLSQVTDSRGPLPGDYTGQLMVFGESLPPLGWRSNAEYDYVYVMGASDKGSLVPETDHVHGGTIKMVKNSDDKHDWSINDASAPGMAHKDHEHADTAYVSDDAPSKYDTYRIEVMVMYYKDGYEQNGVSIVTSEFAFDCGGVYWAESATVCSGGRGTCDAESGVCECADDGVYGDVFYGTICESVATCGPDEYDAVGVCSDKGVCTQPDVCTCDLHPLFGDVYYGALCESEALCGGLPFNDSSVCAGVGNCTVPDLCTCPNHFFGDSCENELHCNGYIWSNPLGCTNRGECDGGANDTCVCDPGYDGTFCERIDCYGTLDDELTVCSEKGTCVAPDDCDCWPVATWGQVWIGDECDEPTLCGGMPHYDSGSCHYGNCTEGAICACDDVHEGSLCETPLCFGVPATDGGVCTGHGTCMDAREPYCACTSHLEYTGVDCSIPVCFGVLATDTVNVCHFNGTCTAHDTCVCLDDDRYTGPNCDVPVCNGVPESEPTSCNGVFGECVSVDVCVCTDDALYTGEWCHLAVCDDLVADDPAVCSASNGTCDAPDTCTCVDVTKYVGEWCDIPVCYGIRADDPTTCYGHGICYDWNDCDCHTPSEYVGLNCDVPVCLGYSALETDLVCNDGNGTCVDAPTFPVGIPVCDCDVHHYGVDCDDDYQCAGKYWHDFYVCTNRTRGDCQEGECVCANGYMGDNCEYQICDGIPSYDAGVCSGNGACLTPDGCRCDRQWTGEWCENKAMCGEFTFDNLNVCRMRGVCFADTGCECEDGYGGSECQEATCFGFSSDDEDHVCSGHGVCWATDECSCWRTYYGMECEEHFPLSSVLLSGMATDVSFLVEIPYTVDAAYIPDVELPFGTWFNCSERLMKNYAALLIGGDATCCWHQLNAATHQNQINVTIDASAAVLALESADVDFNLLTSGNNIFFAPVTIIVDLTVETETITEKANQFDPVIMAAVLVPVLLILAFTVGLVFFLCVFFVVNRKKNKLAEQRMLDKMRELQQVQEMNAADREKLELAIRLQKMKAQADVPLPETFTQLTAFDDDNHCVLMDALVPGKVWGRTKLRRCVWRGHKLVMRQLDTDIKQVTKRAVNGLVARATEFAAVPPHAHLRRYHSYMIEGVGLGVVKAEAKGPRLLQAMMSEKTAADDEGAGDDTEGGSATLQKHGSRVLAPDHGVIMNEVPGGTGEVCVVDYMWAKRKEASEALEGVTVLSGVTVEDKVRWLLQAAQALSHLHLNGVVLRHLNIHCLLLDEKNNAIVLDMPYLNRDAAEDAFAAPEVVSDSLGRHQSCLEDDAQKYKADVYSFGIILYCILTETKRPYRLLQRMLPSGVRIGERAASTAMFRPPLAGNPLLRSWGHNLMLQCWAADPADRLTMVDVVERLERISHAFSVCEDANLRSESSEATDFSSSDAGEEPLEGAEGLQVTFENLLGLFNEGDGEGSMVLAGGEATPGADSPGGEDQALLFGAGAFGEQPPPPWAQESPSTPAAPSGYAVAAGDATPAGAYSPGGGEGRSLLFGADAGAGDGEESQE